MFMFLRALLTQGKSECLAVETLNLDPISSYNQCQRQRSKADFIFKGDWGVARDNRFREYLTSRSLS